VPRKKNRTIQDIAAERQEIRDLLAKYDEELSSVTTKRRDAEDRLKQAEQDLEDEYTKLTDNAEYWKKKFSLRANELLHDYQYEEVPHGTGAFFSLRFDKFRTDAPIFVLSVYCIKDAPSVVEAGKIPREVLDRVGHMVREKILHPLFPTDGKPAIKDTEVRPHGSIEPHALSESNRVAFLTKFDIVFPKMDDIDEDSVEKTLKRVKKLANKLVKLVGEPQTTSDLL
jgi:hypothetical protein